MATKKDRRNDGCTTPALLIEGKVKDIAGRCLEPEPFWDEWDSKRDGLRGYYDRTRMNGGTFNDGWDRWRVKNKRLQKVRQAMKRGRFEASVA